MPTGKIKAKKAKKSKTALSNANITVGVKKAPASKGEVAGHTSPGAWYYCGWCGALNWVGPGYDAFICGACYRVNRC